MLESYRQDLTAAEEQGRNLLTEKYAFMMKSTSPSEYEKIEQFLPALSAELISVVEKIISAVLAWEEEIKRKYPHIAGKSRPIYSSQDSPQVTSIETYLRGELSTYSLNTLNLYLKNIQDQQNAQVNGSEITLKYMMKCYGFKNLEDAEKVL